MAVIVVHAAIMPHLAPPFTATRVLAALRRAGDPSSLPFLAAYGIDVSRAFGVRVPVLRAWAKQIGRDQRLAQALWRSRLHEARILASMVADPAVFTRRQAEAWARDFRSWDICDQCCLNLFRRLPRPHALALALTRRRAEFTRRAGFSLLAVLAVHDKAAPVASWRPALAAVERVAGDARPMVMKGANWALRQIGKRDAACCRLAMPVARRLARDARASARWIGHDAVRELRLTGR